MLDVKKIIADAEAEVREEQMRLAKDKIKILLRKKEQARQVQANIERELNDAYAELGQGTTI